MTSGKARDRHYQSRDLNDRLIINIRDMNRTMHSLYEGKASQRRILIILNEVQAVTQRELTEWLGIRPGSASEVLAKLENAGLILKTASETDRRTTNITLTEAGRQQAEEAARQRSVRHREMFSCLSEEERAMLLTLLEKVNSDWETRYQGVKEHPGRGMHAGEEHSHYRHDRESR